jgi:hypothetical protein
MTDCGTSALGRSRYVERASTNSALAPKADIWWRSRAFSMAITAMKRAAFSATQTALHFVPPVHLFLCPIRHELRSENLTKRWVLLPPAEPNQCQYRGELSFLSEIHAVGVDLFLHQQGIDTTTPGGKAMFQMLGVFAEFERSIIQERVRAGLRRAKAEGKQLGRPRISAELEQQIEPVLIARLGVQEPGSTQPTSNARPSSRQRCGALIACVSRSQGAEGTKKRMWG